MRAGQAHAIVGCPHNETAVNAAGIGFSGYPNLIARLSEVPEDQVFLMLIGDRLRVVHVTLHERLQTALMRLHPALVETAGRAAAAALVTLGIKEPRLGICAINPHAGEGGLFGDDDAALPFRRPIGSARPVLLSKARPAPMCFMAAPTSMVSSPCIMIRATSRSSSSPAVPP